MYIQIFTTHTRTYCMCRMYLLLYIGTYRQTETFFSRCSVIGRFPAFPTHASHCNIASMPNQQNPLRLPIFFLLLLRLLNATQSTFIPSRKLETFTSRLYSNGQPSFCERFLYDLYDQALSFRIVVRILLHRISSFYDSLFI